MRFYNAADFSPSVGRTYDEIVSDIDGCFADGWSKHRERLAGLTSELATDFVALRKLLSTCSASGKWPLMAGAQSFVLTHNRSFYMRVNLWFPEPKDTVGLERLRKYLSIGECHNHSYNFFTTCLFGSGYESQFLTASFSERPRTGEQLNLVAGELVRLRPRDVLFVERDVDFHTQQWPIDFSVTLNLVPLAIEDTGSHQYIVDEENGLVRNVIAVGA